MTKTKFKKFYSLKKMLNAVEELPYRNEKRVGFVSSTKPIKPRYKSPGFNIYYLNNYEFYFEGNIGERYSSISKGFIELVKPRYSSSSEGNNKEKLEGLAMAFNMVEWRNVESTNIHMATYFKFHTYDDREKLLNNVITNLFYEREMNELSVIEDIYTPFEMKRFGFDDEKISRLEGSFDDEILHRTFDRSSFPGFAVLWKNDPDFKKKLADGIFCIKEIERIEYQKGDSYFENKKN